MKVKYKRRFFFLLLLMSVCFFAFAQRGLRNNFQEQDSIQNLQTVETVFVFRRMLPQGASFSTFAHVTPNILCTGLGFLHYLQETSLSAL